MPTLHPDTTIIGPNAGQQTILSMTIPLTPMFLDSHTSLIMNYAMLHCSTVVYGHVLAVWRVAHNWSAFPLRHYGLMVLPFHCGNHSPRASAFLQQSQPPGFCLSAALAASRPRAYLTAKTNQFLVTSTCPTQPSLIRVVYACLHAICVRGMLKFKKRGP